MPDDPNTGEVTGTPPPWQPTRHVLCRCGHDRGVHAAGPTQGERDGCTAPGCPCRRYTLSAEGIREVQRCPDGGTCHHACSTVCWRREWHYDALTPDGTWPLDPTDPVDAAITRMRDLLVRPSGEPDPLAEGWLAAARDQQAGDRERQAVQLLTQAVLIRHQRTSSSGCACGELPLGTSYAEHVTRHLAAEGVLRGRP